MLDSLYYFLVIQNFSALITLLASSFAFAVYFIQKRDRKISAARLILSETRNAERKIYEIAELVKSRSKDFPRVLTSNSWKTYSYLFTSDFDQDQLTEISQFFSICENIDEYVQKDNSFFWINSQRRAEVVQEKLADAIYSSFDVKSNTLDDVRLTNIVDTVLETISNHNYSYAPKKTVNYLSDYISKYKPITTTTTGSHLKRLARDNR